MTRTRAAAAYRVREIAGCDGKSAHSVPNTPAGHWLSGCRCQVRRVELLEEVCRWAQEWRGIRSDLAEAADLTPDLVPTLRDQQAEIERRLVAAICAVEEHEG